MQERLQKIISNAGIVSRRKAEELILQGKVIVNGRKVTELGFKADASKDEIKVKGKAINTTNKVTYIVNKPKGYICTNSDPEGRKRVIDLLPTRGHFYTIGRLDINSSGLILLTNDGNLSQKIIHPRQNIIKTYRAILSRPISEESEKRLTKAMKVDKRKVDIYNARISGDRKSVTIGITEGRNRVVRNIFEILGMSVKELKRIGIGKLTLRNIPEGGFRKLTDRDLSAIFDKKGS